KFIFEHPIFEKSLDNTTNKVEKLQENVQVLEKLMSYLKIDYKIIFLSEAIDRLFKNSHYLSEFQAILSNIRVENLIKGSKLEYIPFDKIDIYSDTYIIEPADEFIEITEETNVLEEVSDLIHARNHKYYVFLEKGQYNFVDVNQQSLRVQFFDLEFKQQSFTPLPSHLYGIELFIPEDGYYYMNISQGLSNNLGYAFYLEPRNYETTWFDDEVLNIGTNTVTFEGNQDIVRFKLDSEDTKILKIVSDNKDINIYPHDYFLADGIYYLEVPEGVSYFSLISSVARTIHLEVSEVDSSNYSNQVLNTMEEIQEVSSKLIVTSNNLGPRYLKLVVTEKAYYHLDYLRAGEGYALHGANLLNQNLVKISSFHPAGHLLDIGTYVIRIHTSELSLGYIKYRKEIIEDETLELNMTKMDYNEVTSKPLTYCVAILYHKDHYVDFHFYTAESTALYISQTTDHYQFLDEERNPITMVFGTNFYTEVSQIFYFEPGDYYLRVYGRNDYEHFIGLFLTFLSNPPEDDSKAGSDIPWITIGTHDFLIDYPEDVEIFKIDITVQGKYKFYSSIIGYPLLYDASFNQLPQQTDNYTLAPGLYYIFLPNRGGSHRSLNISKVG
ncbi:MAG: hypothetical protein KKH92_00985, partial [Firmicutes bacterium]|nr:hypothetical protein [Bacillota bacterium]